MDHLRIDKMGHFKQYTLITPLPHLMLSLRSLSIYGPTSLLSLHCLVLIMENESNRVDLGAHACAAYYRRSAYNQVLA